MLFANILGIYKVIMMLCVQASLKEFKGEGCKRVKVVNHFSEKETRKRIIPHFLKLLKL